MALWQQLFAAGFHFRALACVKKGENCSYRATYKNQCHNRMRHRRRARNTHAIIGEAKRYMYQAKYTGGQNGRALTLVGWLHPRHKARTWGIICQPALLIYAAWS